MTLLAAEGKSNQYRTERGVEPTRRPERCAEPQAWKKTVSETLHALQIIPERFNGRVVVTFKDGGISYLEKTETMK